MNQIADLHGDLRRRLHERANAENCSIADLLSRLLDETVPSYQQLLMDRLTDAVITVDTRMHITGWNPGAEHIYGWSVAEALGQHLDDLLQTEWQGEGQHLAWAALEQHGQWVGVIRQTTRDGRQRRIQASMQLLRNAQGRITGGITVNRDVTDQQQMQEALDRAENRYRWLIENSRDAILVYDARQQMVFANRAVEAITGYTVEEIRQMSPSDLFNLVHPDDADDLAAYAYRRFQPGESCPLHEHRLRHRNGSYRRLETETIPLLNHRGEIEEVVTISRDITDRKQAEDALRQSETRLRSLVESQTNFVIRTDIEGKYTYVNQAFFERYRWLYRDVNDLLGRSGLETIIPEDHGEMRAAGGAAIRSPGTPVQVMVRKPKANGGVFWTLWELVAITDQHGIVTEVQCVGIDVSELIQAREQLQLQEQVMVVAANAIMVTDREGTIRWVNPAFTRLTGYTLDESIGKKANLLNSGRHNAAFYEAMWSTIKAGQVWTGKMINRRKDGTLYIEEQTITPVLDTAGQISQFIAIKQDITEREHNNQLALEHERLKARYQKEQEQSALTKRLISALSHDLRTPLTVITTTAEMLRRHHDRLPVENREQRLDTIGHQVGFIVDMMQDTIEILRGTPGEEIFHPAPINLRALCEVSLDEIRTTDAAQHHLTFINRDGLETVNVDEILVSRMLLNLLANAVKYSAPGTEVRLILERRENWLLLQVSDQGIGIDPDDLPHIFEPFYRVSRVRHIEGSGLGLSIVRDCVERHRGSIRVSSTPGIGTTFTVELPL